MQRVFYHIPGKAWPTENIHIYQIGYWQVKYVYLDGYNKGKVFWQWNDWELGELE